MVIGVGTDQLFPIAQQRELAEMLKPMCGEVELVELPSIQGHDSFLADPGRFGPVIGRFIAAP
jgi:homoserine acetyltransferase